MCCMGKIPKDNSTYYPKHYTEGDFYRSVENIQNKLSCKKSNNLYIYMFHIFTSGPWCEKYEMLVVFDCLKQIELLSTTLCCQGRTI